MSAAERALCVFCGSQTGRKPAYLEATRRLARALVDRGYGLVFGGGRVGLMGALADEVLAAGGHVTGVIPKGLVQREVAHAGVSELVVVGTMHERKRVMAERAIGFIALPGGLGTFEEFFEVFTWAQLGIHGKPCGLLDVDGYFGAMLRQLDHAVAEGFILGSHRQLLLVDSSPEVLLERFAAHVPADVQRWMDAGEE